jgi:peptidoglycan/xylan/chitin deacetylase (PgdA/CDA1 family)
LIRGGIGRLRQTAQWFKNRSGRRALILLYHRVADLRSDPWSLGVTPSHFAEHLEVLQRYAYPMELRQLSQGLLNGNLPDRSVLVTFDDGYADNLHNAKPVLERYNVPATFFLTTGYIGHEREFWWDELDRLLLQPGTLPETLCLSVNGSTYRWMLGKAAYYDEGSFRRYQRWRAWEDAPSSRHSLYASLYELLYPLMEGERRKVLNELLLWADAKPMVRPTHRSLSLEEVFALAQGELIEVGTHTVTHPALPTLPTASQWDEISESKDRLEEILGRQVYSFAYPHGSMSAQTVRLVREAGFTCACSCIADVTRLSSDHFRLPRIEVANWDGEMFAKRLSWWFGRLTTFAHPSS